MIILCFYYNVVELSNIRKCCILTCVLVQQFILGTTLDMLCDCLFDVKHRYAAIYCQGIAVSAHASIYE